MTDSSPIERPFSSTTFRWKYVKMSRSPEAIGTALRRSTFWRSLPKRSPRTALWCSLKLNGGAEAWVEIECRGRLGRVPGSMQLVDVVRMLNNDR